ncbi:unnamed protein product [Microthlaspi erraticum]|uniref:Uncharacterized protein n=1 Tax=Microthlaspi erraticum TaxID=1685480 RepID=A0A6D2KUI6_9BRAS|nr:unnamed protein product [Microthlaspi erraticum]CAA7056858.1 unnamed protein product [Microthlaspi erraticum]
MVSFEVGLGGLAWDPDRGCSDPVATSPVNWPGGSGPDEDRVWRSGSVRWCSAPVEVTCGEESIRRFPDFLLLARGGRW